MPEHADTLYACDGSHCGVFSKHWLRRAAARRARFEAAYDRRLDQLLGCRWVVERIPEHDGA